MIELNTVLLCFYMFTLKMILGIPQSGEKKNL